MLNETFANFSFVGIQVSTGFAVIWCWQARRHYLEQYWEMTQYVYGTSGWLSLYVCDYNVCICNKVAKKSYWTLITGYPGYIFCQFSCRILVHGKLIIFHFHLLVVIFHPYTFLCPCWIQGIKSSYAPFLDNTWNYLHTLKNQKRHPCDITRDQNSEI